MKKIFMPLGLLLFALSMQLEAATMTWVDAPEINVASSTTQITAEKNYLADSGSETVDFTFNLDQQTTINSAVIEFFDNQVDVDSVTLLTGGQAFSFAALGDLGKWTLANVVLGAGDHTIRIAVASALTGAQIDVKVNQVPLPAAVWLFGSALLGLMGVTRRFKTQQQLISA